MNSAIKSLNPWLVSSLLISFNSFTPAVSQPIQSASDGTNTRVTPTGNRFDIQGGQRSSDEANLFHSFEKFGLNQGQTANFLSTPEIRNILGRITGGDASYINGLIQITGGNSNLFLMNPAGIVFGPNSSLNVPASFSATTANSIGFGNHLFNSVGVNQYDLLVGSPSNFNFTNVNPSAIINAGVLAVNEGQNLTLTGGTIINTGQLFAPGGNITLMAVPGENTVRLTQAGMILNLEFLPPTIANQTDSISPTKLPALLTGGGDTHAAGLTVNTDGTVQLTGSGFQIENGDIVVANQPTSAVAAHTAILSASNNLILIESQFNTTEDLSLIAGNTIRIRDSINHPFIAKAGEDLLIQGQQNIDILALNHPQFPITSGGDLKLVSNGVVSGDAHFSSGGSFSILNPSGNPSSFRSILDPIILSEGDVTFDDYTGLSLWIESKGSITTGNIIINGIDPKISSEPLLVLRAGLTELSNPATLTLENTQIEGETVFTSPINVSSQGTINVENITIDADGIGGPVILEALGNLQTAGIISNGGDIFLSSQEGQITTTDTLNSTLVGGDSGSITLRSQAGITTESLNASSTDGNSGKVTLYSEAGVINTSAGTVDTSSVNGDGGEVILYVLDATPITTAIEATPAPAPNPVPTPTPTPSPVSTSPIFPVGGLFTGFNPLPLPTILEPIFLPTPAPTTPTLPPIAQPNIITGSINTASVNGLGGKVTLYAGGGIDVSNITTAGLTGGDVMIISAENAVDTRRGTVDTRGENQSGKITLQAETNLSTGNLEASSLTGYGGQISLYSRIGNIDTRAGMASTFSNSGTAGEIIFYAAEEGITIADLNATSTTGTNGEITIYGVDNINIANQSSPQIAGGEITFVSKEGSIDTSNGSLISNSNSAINLFASAGITTRNITSNGGDINLVVKPHNFLERNIGNIDTTQGTLNSTSQDEKGGDIRLLVTGDFTVGAGGSPTGGEILTGEIVSGGGNVSLASVWNERLAFFNTLGGGDINSTGGTIDSSYDPDPENPDIGGHVFLQGYSITVGNIFSDGNNIDILSFSEGGLTPTGSHERGIIIQGDLNLSSDDEVTGTLSLQQATSDPPSNGRLEFPNIPTSLSIPPIDPDITPGDAPKQPPEFINFVTVTLPNINIGDLPSEDPQKPELPSEPEIEITKPDVTQPESTQGQTTTTNSTNSQAQNTGNVETNSTNSQVQNTGSVETNLTNTEANSGTTTSESSSPGMLKEPTPTPSPGNSPIKPPETTPLVSIDANLVNTNITHLGTNSNAVATSGSSNTGITNPPPSPPHSSGDPNKQPPEPTPSVSVGIPSTGIVNTSPTSAGTSSITITPSGNNNTPIITTGTSRTDYSTPKITSDPTQTNTNFSSHTTSNASGSSIINSGQSANSGNIFSTSTNIESVNARVDNSVPVQPAHSTILTSQPLQTPPPSGNTSITIKNTTQANGNNLSSGNANLGNSSSVTINSNRNSSVISSPTIQSSETINSQTSITPSSDAQVAATVPTNSETISSQTEGNSLVTTALPQSVNSSDLEGNDQTHKNNPQINEISPNLMSLAREVKDCLEQENLTRETIETALRNSQKNYNQAIDCYSKNLQLARQLGDQVNEVNVLNNLGISYYAQGNYSQAIEHHQQQLVLAQYLQNALAEAQSYSGLGATYGAIGDYEKAIMYYQYGLKLAISNNAGELQGTLLRNLGLAYYAQKNYPQALEYQKRSLALAQKGKNLQGELRALGNLGRTYYTLTDYEQAIKYQQQSLELARNFPDQHGEMVALENLGLAYYAQEKYEQAIDYHRQSLALAQQFGDRHAEARSLTNLGDALAKAKQTEAATKTLLRAIEIWESLRQNLGTDDLNKVLIFETQETTYSTLQDLLVEQNQLNQALEMTERGRARAFVELLTTGLSSQSVPAQIEHPNISEIQKIARSQNATLVSYSIMKQVVEKQNTRQLQDAELFIWVVQPTGEIKFHRQDLTSLNTTLKELVPESRISLGVRSRGEEETLAFAAGDFVKLKDDAPDWEPWQVVGVNEATQQLELTQSSFAEGVTISRPISDVISKVESVRGTNLRLQKLYQILIEPIVNLLPANPEERVVFIPHGELFLVPFAALQDANGNYLIEKHTILTAPAIQVLDLTYQQKQQLTNNLDHSKLPALVVGNPKMPAISTLPGQPAQPLAPLPNAEIEAIEIAQLLKTTPLIGTAPTKAIVIEKMQQSQIIHLATHGLLDDAQGLESAIALAPNETDSGLLTANEILNLKLQAKLVVLSACNTGRGKITGDGVIGLSRALMSAGVPSAIVSLWTVPDAPTASLMAEFYQQLQLTNDKAKALRNAMLITMKSHPNPRDWAAFILMGQP